MKYTPFVTGGETPHSVGEMACVLLHPAGTAPPMRLCRALGNKRIRVTPCTDAFAALALLCRGGREGGVSLNILLIAEPESRAESGELVELAGLFAPQSVCWMYTGAPSEQVREIRESDLGHWRRVNRAHHAEPPAVEVKPGAGPTLRIVDADEPGSVGGLSGVIRSGGDPGGPGGRTTGEAEGRSDPEPLLTDEELSMLLSDDLEGERNGGRR